MYAKIAWLGASLFKSLNISIFNSINLSTASIIRSAVFTARAKSVVYDIPANAVSRCSSVMNPFQHLFPSHQLYIVFLYLQPLPKHLGFEPDNPITCLGSGISDPSPHSTATDDRNIFYHLDS